VKKATQKLTKKRGGGHAILHKRHAVEEEIAGFTGRVQQASKQKTRMNRKKKGIWEGGGTTLEREKPGLSAGKWLTDEPGREKKKTLTVHSLPMREEKKTAKEKCLPPR